MPRRNDEQKNKQIPRKGSTRRFLHAGISGFPGGRAASVCQRGVSVLRRGRKALGAAAQRTRQSIPSVMTETPRLHAGSASTRVLDGERKYSVRDLSWRDEEAGTRHEEEGVGEVQQRKGRAWNPYRRITERIMTPGGAAHDACASSGPDAKRRNEDKVTRRKREAKIRESRRGFVRRVGGAKRGDVGRKERRKEMVQTTAKSFPAFCTSAIRCTPNGGAGASMNQCLGNDPRVRGEGGGRTSLRSEDLPDDERSKEEGGKPGAWQWHVQKQEPLSRL
ncbi:hypothetical protein B0H19DRAFT_1062824 [Mycena capillaripes]|nr:hypothetical protein B0H19DRAFT_1062824 [Mycena capillaripes]